MPGDQIAGLNIFLCLEILLYIWLVFMDMWIFVIRLYFFYLDSSSYEIGFIDGYTRGVEDGKPIKVETTDRWTTHPIWWSSRINSTTTHL